LDNPHGKLCALSQRFLPTVGWCFNWTSTIMTGSKSSPRSSMMLCRWNVLTYYYLLTWSIFFVELPCIR
jgi:hypothetical protein